jgi:hypothetical protein
MGITDAVLHFIGDNIDCSSQTLETGCGLSTVLFALTGGGHICITPAQAEIDCITEYCRSNDIPTNGLRFYPEVSESVLPRLECAPLDLVLIDGRHGFPAPFIDFYYSASKLKLGGLLIIDDTWLWTGDVLKQHLLLEPEWELVADFLPRTVVFRKLAEGSQSKEWYEQSFVAQNSQVNLNEVAPSHLVTSLRYVKRGEFSVLGKKVIGKLTGRRRST